MNFSLEEEVALGTAEYHEAAFYWVHLLGVGAVEADAHPGEDQAASGHLPAEAVAGAALHSGDAQKNLYF
ncbi:hypothetical protein GPM19_08050 [Halomonas sp. ZH2S]|uniref:Uncharacterized protein n=1 Tax=Vreelandella zhuhanensis TaxID=2684210 RepID=A0A7X3KR96_9GAMM|nr:hypothetical protein [Halomonas zhuhanensis]MWJ28156.1 hypothetical protein [Halomonas zhuhanensis]